jgi:hypothetical protein
VNLQQPIRRRQHRPIIDERFPIATQDDLAAGDMHMLPIPYPTNRGLHFIQPRELHRPHLLGRLLHQPLDAVLHPPEHDSL